MSTRFKLQKVHFTFVLETTDVLSVIKILTDNFRMKDFHYEVMEE